MTTLNISLPDEMQEFIEAQVSKEVFASASEYPRCLVREAQEREAKQSLEAQFREALESGPAAPMTREDWDSIEREAVGRRATEHGKEFGNRRSD